MMCLNPICLEGKGILPCGVCRYCRQLRAESWAIRMMHEKQYWSKSIFVTLTYMDEYLPKGGYLDKGELQKFIKRVRKRMETKIKYYAAGEYGERYGRPHYHLIMFGLGSEDRKIIEESWMYGFIKIGEVSRQSCRYVAKYLTKAILGRSWRDRYGAEKPMAFQVCSHGLGLRWIMENAERVGEAGISYKGRRKSLPRYYVNKIRQAGVSDRIVEESRAENMSKLREYYERLEAEGIRGTDALARYREELRLQRIEELKTKDSMRRIKDME